MKSWVEILMARGGTGCRLPGRSSDKATLRFRYRLPLVPGLDAKSVREIIDTRDLFQERLPGPTKVEMSLAPEIVLKETDKAWIRSSDEVRAEPTGEGALISFEDGDPSSRKLPFTFKALALEPVPLPVVRGAAAVAQDGFRR